MYIVCQDKKAQDVVAIRHPFLIRASLKTFNLTSHPFDIAQGREPVERQADYLFNSDSQIRSSGLYYYQGTIGAVLME